METILKLRIKNKTGTNTYWALHSDFVPLKGEIIVYEDHKISIDENNVKHNIPGFKFGDGVTTVGKLPFATADLEQVEALLQEHINNSEIHLSVKVEGENIVFYTN